MDTWAYVVCTLDVLHGHFKLLIMNYDLALDLLYCLLRVSIMLAFLLALSPTLLTPLICTGCCPSPNARRAAPFVPPLRPLDQPFTARHPSQSLFSAGVVVGWGAMVQ